MFEMHDEDDEENDNVSKWYRDDPLNPAELKGEIDQVNDRIGLVHKYHKSITEYARKRVEVMRQDIKKLFEKESEF